MQQPPPPKTLRIIINFTDPEPTKPGATPAAEHVVLDVFDERTVSEIRNLVHAIVRGDYLQQEREDCLQETLLHLWQIMNANPAQDAGSQFSRCRGFIQNLLKHGRSIDSPKRRSLGRSIDSVDFRRSCEDIPQLNSNMNPYHHASARDDIKQVCVRLNSRDQEILSLSLEGNGTREVAKRLHICASVVCKGTRRIRAVALKLGLNPGATNRSKKKNEKK